MGATDVEDKHRMSFDETPWADIKPVTSGQLH